MERMAEAEKITLAVGNKVIDVTKGIDRSMTWTDK